MSSAHVMKMLARTMVRAGLLPALFVSLATLTAHAQTGHGPVQVLSVIGHDWYKDFPSLARDNGFKPEYEGIDSERATGCRACPEGNAPCDHAETDCPCGRRLNHPSSSDPPESRSFVYRVTLRNGGGRPVKTVIWDYVFRDPKTDAELARHTFATDIRLAPGKTRLLSARSFAPPTRVISAQMLLQAGAVSSYAERIEIKTIVFADGSVMSY